MNARACAPVAGDVVNWWMTGGWPWLSGWMHSPGFAGTAAVAAALIAYFATRRKTRMDAWWQRAEWALNLYVAQTSTSFEREVGAAALLELQRSTLGSSGEQDFLASVVTAVTLDPMGDGDLTDDAPEPSSDDGDRGAYLEQPERPEGGEQ